MRYGSYFLISAFSLLLCSCDQTQSTKAQEAEELPSTEKVEPFCVSDHAREAVYACVPDETINRKKLIWTFEQWGKTLPEWSSTRFDMDFFLNRYPITDEQKTCLKTHLCKE